MMTQTWALGMTNGLSGLTQCVASHASSQGTVLPSLWDQFEWSGTQIKPFLGSGRCSLGCHRQAYARQSWCGYSTVLTGGWVKDWPLLLPQRLAIVASARDSCRRP